MKRTDKLTGSLMALLTSVIVVFVTQAFAQAASWETKSPMPTLRGWLAAGTISGQLYVVGGNPLEVYDPTTDTWSEKAPMPTARTNIAAGVIDGKLYVVGGMNRSNDAMATLEVYDPVTDTWTMKAPMPTARLGAAAGVIGGKLYVIGGRHPVFGDFGLKVLEVYDPTTDTWTTKAPMPTKRYYAAAGGINGQLYVSGGCCLTVATLEVYDPATNTWTSKASMPTARSGAAAGVIGGKLYVVGGGDPFGALLSTLQVYDPLIDAWTTEAPMPTARNNLSAGVINGKLYAVGGYDGRWELATLEVFIPANIPVCNIEMSQASYLNGETVTAQVLRIANPTAAPLAIELKLWFDVPTIPPVSFVNIGANGDIVLPAGFDQNFGPLSLATVTEAFPRGTYGFNCRILHPVSGGLLVEDLNPFDIQ